MSDGTEILRVILGIAVMSAGVKLARRRGVRKEEEAWREVCAPAAALGCNREKEEGKMPVNRYFITVEYISAGYAFTLPYIAEATTLGEAKTDVRTAFTSTHMPDTEIVDLKHTDTVRNVTSRSTLQRVTP